MRRPHRCPVCGGKGAVPQGFYNVHWNEGTTSTAPIPEMCRSCQGTGILWEETTITFIPGHDITED
jgi:hypothetical protein